MKIRISQLRQRLDDYRLPVEELAARALRVKREDVLRARLTRKSVDARDKGDVHFTLTVEAETVRPMRVPRNAEEIREGDTAGLCLLIGSYGLAGITREADGMYLVMKAREAGQQEEQERIRIPWHKKTARLRAEVRFDGMKGIVRFFYLSAEKWEPLGPAHEMIFLLDHFTGCRFGLFLYASRETGGSAAFRRFRFSRQE